MSWRSYLIINNTVFSDKKSKNLVGFGLISGWFWVFYPKHFEFYNNLCGAMV
jgi:hypothetical protein